jgi:hypothetical protein
MNRSPDSFAGPSGAPADRQDRLIEAHLARELDPQLGQARRRFERMLADGRAAGPLRPGNGLSWNHRWTIGVLTALAACMALGVGMWNLDQGTSPPVQVGAGDGGESAMRPVGYTPLEYRESWQSQDLGTYEFEGRPVRAVHRKQWETTRYRDAKGYEVKLELPREQLVLVDAPVQ